MAKERKHGEKVQPLDGEVREGCTVEVRYLPVSRDLKGEKTTWMPGECPRPSGQHVQRPRGRNLSSLLGDVVREVDTESGKARYEGPFRSSSGPWHLH